MKHKEKSGLKKIQQKFLGAEDVDVRPLDFQFDDGAIIDTAAVVYLDGTIEIWVCSNLEHSQPRRANQFNPLKSYPSCT